MPVRFEKSGGVLTAVLEGDIDHHIAPSIRAQIDAEIERLRPEVLAMDFSRVSFMDSSGVGIVIGRYKLMRSCGGKVVLRNLAGHIRSVFSLSGLQKLVTIEEEEK